MNWMSRLRSIVPKRRVREELAKAEGSELAAAYHGKKSIPTGEAPQKKDRAWLEKFYYMEPLLFAGVNFFVHQVVGPGFKIVGPKKETLLCQDFAKRTNLQALLEKVQLDCGTFGNSFCEKLRDADGKLVGLGGIDAKSMEFIESTDRTILFDGMSKPVGYIQTITTERQEDRFKQILLDKGIKPGVGHYLGGVPFSREEIIHFKLYSLSDTEMGVGLIEPLFDTALLKMEAEEGLGKGLKRVGQPLVVAYIGKEGVELPPEARNPSPDTIKKFSDDVMAHLEDMKDITLPYYYKLALLEPTRITQLKEYLDYYSYLICSGLGIPHSILLSGERIGSKVADIQADNVVRIIKSYQSNLARTVEREVFEPLIKEAGLIEVPKLVFRTVSPALLAARMGRLTEAIRSGAITPDRKIEEFLREENELPPIGEEDAERVKERENFRWKKFSDTKGVARKGDTGEG